MGTSLNFSIVGFVGSDPQVSTVQTSNGEQTVASFSVAVSRKNGGGQKQTLWIRVNCWGNLSNVAQQYVKKGSPNADYGGWSERPSLECARVDDLQGRARSICRTKTARSQA